jgi:hypothetical protein
MPRGCTHETVIDDELDYEPGILEVIIEHRRTKRGIVTKERVVRIPRFHPPRRAKARQETSSTSKQRTQRQQMELEGPRPPPLKVLRTYAKLPDTSIATALPPTVYFSHTQHTITIFDAYPKALFHFLVLPRLSNERSSSDLTDLRTLLRRRASAEETLRVLAEEAVRLRGVIEEEMRTRYGFVWDVWAGFHAVPSME